MFDIGNRSFCTCAMARLQQKIENALNEGRILVLANENETINIQS
jgi:hypothetical protein